MRKEMFVNFNVVVRLKNSTQDFCKMLGSFSEGVKPSLSIGI